MAALTRDAIIAELRKHDVHPKPIGQPRRAPDGGRIAEVQFEEEPEIGPIFTGRGSDIAAAQLDALRHGLRYFRQIDGMDGR